MANRTKRTPKKARQFIESLVQTGGNVARACKATAIGRTAVYAWRNDDEEFAQAWDEAVEAGLDELEQEARRRAVEGTLEPRFYKGIECGHIRKYSDTLLIFLLKAGRPEKYRDRIAQQLAHQHEVKIIKIPAKLTLEAWQQQTENAPA
jgi:hypothetical protein